MSGKILYLQPLSGISGDMLCAALASLGLDHQDFLKQLNLLLPDVYCTLEPCMKNGINSLKFSVLDKESGIEVDRLPESHSHEHTHSHSHEHEHTHSHSHEHEHTHSHSHEHEHTHSHSHEHRGYKDIVSLIQKSSLPERARELAISAFTYLGEAEAEVHGTTIDHIHFHEVGARDSIIDICAACLALDLLDVNEVHVGPIATGSGQVKAAHGLMPVPAPATTLLLNGFECETGPANCELTTPTGAALLQAFSAQSKRGMPSGKIALQGRGAGTKTFKTHANVLTASLICSSAPSLKSDEIFLLSCNIDNSSGEVLGQLYSQAMELGALDLFIFAGTMKKNRPAVQLQLQCRPQDEQRFCEWLLTHSGSIGLRISRERRITLERRMLSKETPYGLCRFKEVILPDNTTRLSPEFDDIVKISAKRGIPFLDLWKNLSALNEIDR